MSTTRQKRNEILTNQKDCCKLCSYHFSRDLQSCYDETTNTLLCHLCLMLLNSLRKSILIHDVDLIKATQFDINNRPSA